MRSRPVISGMTMSVTITSNGPFSVHAAIACVGAGVHDVAVLLEVPAHEVAHHAVVLDEQGCGARCPFHFAP